MEKSRAQQEFETNIKKLSIPPADVLDGYYRGFCKGRSKGLVRGFVVGICVGLALAFILSQVRFPWQPM